MQLPFVLLKHIGKAVLNVVGGGIVGDVIVEMLPQVAREAWESWSKERNEEQRRVEMQSIVQAGVEQIRQDIAEVKREVAADKSEEVRLMLESYLTQVPAMIQRSLRRPSDPSGTTVPASFVPRKAEDLLQFLPTRLPRFKKGDRPLPSLDWELDQLLGVGGFGEVWKARNPNMPSSPPVALKFCLDASAAKALRNETALLDRVMRQGKHSGIVQLLDTYLNAETPCLKYEYIEGGDLTGLIQDYHRQQKGGPSPVFAAKVIMNLAKTLEYAHRSKPPIVHRDLKPANILVQRCPEGLRFKVADFGIGGIATSQAIKQANQGMSQAFVMTSVASGSCTPLYASPQQMRGGPPDPRDDVFSLGVIWYQMLTGDLANGRPGGTLWHKRLIERGLPPKMVDLLASCFEESPEDRPADAGVLASELAGILKAEQAPKAPSASSVPPTGMAEANPAVTRKAEDAPLPTPPKVQQSTLTKQESAASTASSVGDSPPATSQTQSTSAQACVAEVKRVVDTRQGPLGETFTNSIGMKFAWIPPGTFLMGSPPDEEGRRNDESQHKVTLAKGYYMGVYPVTQEEWTSLIAKNPSVKEGNDLAVHGVRWADCQHFIRKLQEQDKKEVRLPTEAEWEYACRAGTTTAYCYGDTIFTDLVNYGDQWYNAPSPVGGFPANAWGLHDMHGNVREWCQDWYAVYPSRDTVAPHGPDNGQYRVTRGGCSKSEAEDCRSACRKALDPGYTGDSGTGKVGFRICFSIDDKSSRAQQYVETRTGTGEDQKAAPQSEESERGQEKATALPTSPPKIPAKLRALIQLVEGELNWSTWTQGPCLGLSDKGLDDAAIAAMATSPSLARWTGLNLSYNDIGPAGAVAIANCPYLTNVVALNWSDTRIGPAGVTALANSPYLANLKDLGLWRTECGDDGVIALANSPHMANVMELGLYGNRIGDAGATALANSPYLVKLRELNLKDNQIGDAGATALANSPCLAKVSELCLSKNQIGDAGATALASSAHLSEVQKLELDGNKIGDAGMEALLDRFGDKVKLL